MTPDTVIDLGRDALSMTIMVSAPLLLAALFTGFVVSLFQAATQINEQTLSFIPKLLSLALMLIYAGSWILMSMIDYTQNLIVEVIPRAIGI
ncbi:MAG: flagellar biosynthesis protein FliQ [Gammaproteobacteria bacterium]|nr:flagellar biosynthesis protein FliQ [Gammaproteobacteria bacterium]